MTRNFHYSWRGERIFEGEKGQLINSEGSQALEVETRRGLFAERYRHGASTIFRSVASLCYSRKRVFMP